MYDFNHLRLDLRPISITVALHARAEEALKICFAGMMSLSYVYIYLKFFPWVFVCSDRFFLLFL